MLEYLVSLTEGFMEERGIIARQPKQPPTIAFLDLTGYTALAEERGDQAAAKLAADLASVVQDAAQNHGGRPVKWLGDGVMFHFADPGSAIVSGLELIEQTAYTLVFGGFLLLGGSAGDLVGRKRIFLVGVVVFTVASLLNGLAPSSEVLVVCRGLQGLGAALVAPAAHSIITTTFAEGAQRAKAMSVWAAIAVGGGAVGLLLGGILVEAFSWPWIFFVNIPVGIAVFVAALRFVPESKDERAHKSFDLAGAVTVTAGLVILLQHPLSPAGARLLSA